MFATRITLLLVVLAALGCERPSGSISDLEFPPPEPAASSETSLRDTAAAPPPTFSDLSFEEQPGGKMPRIPDGAVVTDGPAEGWSHRILFVCGRLASGDLHMVTATVAKYASMFRLAVMANVAHDPSRQTYWLEKVAVGMSIERDGQYVVMVTGGPTGEARKLDLIARNVLAANEKCLDDVIVVARTPTMLVYDAGALMLADGDHQRRLLRHAVLVDPQSGKLNTLVWVINPAANSAQRLESDEFQHLPHNYVEDRILNVLAKKFVLGIPKPEAFALVQPPPGKPIAVPATVRGLAGSLKLSQEELPQWEAALGRLLH